MNYSTQDVTVIVKIMATSLPALSSLAEVLPGVPIVAVPKAPSHRKLRMNDFCWSEERTGDETGVR